MSRNILGIIAVSQARDSKRLDSKLKLKEVLLVVVGRETTTNTKKLWRK